MYHTPRHATPPRAYREILMATELSATENGKVVAILNQILEL